MFPIIVIAIILLGALFWSRSMQARQAAITRCENICKLQGWQFLDDTVALRRLSLKRIEGRWVFVRMYRFEYFRGGEDRLQGEVILHDARVVEELIALQNPHHEERSDVVIHELKKQSPSADLKVQSTIDHPIFQNNILQFPGKKNHHDA